MPALDGIVTAGIDYLLGAAATRGRGIGTRVVAEVSAALFADVPDVAAIVVAVQQANRASWRALERSGYHCVWEGTLSSTDPSDDGPAYP